ncbi:MAG: response regulator [Candidatus Eisenbacteria bacterium]|nr:response regulator [Candidatus Latescibacterota bacterium]MBD3302403.1 response regulator [Candidatus Eisenbacteria bacterium]
MSKGTILVVEDESDIEELIRYHLERENYRVLATGSGEEAVKMTKRERPDLVLLDLMLPGMDGLEVCRTLRADSQVRQIPIVMLTARSEEADIVAGLELGADDYVTKPFRPRVLLARLRAVLRRGVGEGERKDEEAPLSYKGLTVDLGRHQVELRGKRVSLTLTEFNILVHLLRSPGRVFTRYQILDRIQGHDSYVLDRTIDVHVAALRKKLGSFGSNIETVRGVGYRLKDA